MKTKLTIAILAIAMIFSSNVMAQSRGGSRSSDSGSGSRTTSSSTRSSSNSGSSTRSSSSSYRSSSSSSNSSSSGTSYRSGSGSRSTSVSTRSSEPSSSSSVSTRSNSDRNGNSYRSGGSTTTVRNSSSSATVNNAPRTEANMPKYKDRKVKEYSRGESRTVAVHYPRRIERVDDHVHIHYSGVDYYYRDGHYYRFIDNAYVIAPAPRHIRVSVIPTTYFSFRIGSLAYYYSAGAYYNYDPVTLTYEVVDPPMGAIVPELPEYDVNTVVINSKTYLEYDGTLYKPLVTSDGVKYKVMGKFEDIVG